MAERDHNPHLPPINPLGDPPGRARPSDSPVAPPPLNEETRDLATQDVPCRHCGFNLRGLSPAGNCPECGAPIQRSLGGDYLIYSSLQYVSSLHRGVLYILIATIISFVWGLIVSTVAYIRVFSMMATTGAAPTYGGASTFSVTGNHTYDLLLSLVSLPLSIVSLYGWWLFSSQDPAQRYGDIGEMPRRVVRITVFVMAAVTAGSIVVQAATSINPAAVILQFGILGVVLLATLAQFFATMFYIRWLAPRQLPWRVRLFWRRCVLPLR